MRTGIAFLLITGLTACNYMERKGPVQGVVTAVSFTQVHDQILTPHCLQCHGPEGPKADLSTRTRLIEDGWVVPGKPEESPLFESVMAGRMPKGAPPLSDDLKRLLENWILQGAEGEPEPDPPPPPEKTGYQELLATVLGPRCAGCHSGAEPAAGFDITRYDEVLNWVEPGDPEGSDLVAIVDEGYMPPGKNKLNTTQIEKIRSWVREGAQEGN